MAKTVCRTSLQTTEQILKQCGKINNNIKTTEGRLNTKLDLMAAFLSGGAEIKWLIPYKE